MCVGVLGRENAEANRSLTVRLLVAGAGARTAELLRLHTTSVGNQQSAVVGKESLLELVLRLLVDELLVVGNDTLGNSLTDGVDLRGVTTTSDLDADVEVGELVKANNEQGLVNLEAEDLRLDKGDRDTVDLEETLAGLNVGNGGGSLLLAEGLNVSWGWSYNA